VSSDRVRDLLWRAYELPIVDQESYGVLKAAKEEEVAGILVRSIADLAGDMAESECQRNAAQVLLTGAEILERLMQECIELVIL
jgi:nucleoside phosphorylase